MNANWSPVSWKDKPALQQVEYADPELLECVAEIPSVTPETRRVIQARGVADRCQVVECDFFKSIPPGSDAYLLSNILHDWPDEKCGEILVNCHRAMKAGSKLVVVEMVVPPGNAPSVAKLLDLEMMVTTGGRERTEEEFRDLLEGSSFRLSRIISMMDTACVIEGIPVAAE